MNRKFYHEIILTEEEARKFYELLTIIDCPEPVIHCPTCSRYSSCIEYRKIIKALEDYLDEREEE